MSHVAHMNESCHAHELQGSSCVAGPIRIRSHVRRGHVASDHMYEGVMSHTWISATYLMQMCDIHMCDMNVRHSYVRYECATYLIHKCHISIRVKSPVRMGHVAQMHPSYRTYEWVMLHMVMIYVMHTNRRS